MTEYNPGTLNPKPKSYNLPRRPPERFPPAETSQVVDGLALTAREARPENSLCSPSVTGKPFVNFKGLGFRVVNLRPQPSAPNRTRGVQERLVLLACGRTCEVLHVGDPSSLVSGFGLWGLRVESL